jgi:hypothetical protein
MSALSFSCLAMCVLMKWHENPSHTNTEAYASDVT